MWLCNGQAACPGCPSASHPMRAGDRHLLPVARTGKAGKENERLNEGCPLIPDYLQIPGKTICHSSLMVEIKKKKRKKIISRKGPEARFILKINEKYKRGFLLYGTDQYISLYLPGV